MRLRTLGAWGVAIFVSLSAAAPQPASADEKDDTVKLLHALPKSRQTLAAGIRKAAAMAPEVAISAKFELEEGQLSLSVYTAEKGPGADAESRCENCSSRIAESL